MEKRLKLYDACSANSAEVVCCTKTWLDSDFVGPLFPNSTYVVAVKSDRPLGFHGGVLILIKNTIPFHEIEYECDFGCAAVIANCLRILLYNPPKSSHYRVSDFDMVAFLDYVMTAAACYTNNILILGDFNLPSYDWDSFPAEDLTEYSQFFKLLVDGNFEQLLTKPTHRYGNILDLIFTNFTGVHNLCVDEHLIISDHFCISFHFTCSSFCPVAAPLSSRYSISSANIDCLDFDYSTSLFSFSHPDNVSYVQHWISCFMAILNKNVQKRRSKRNYLPAYYTSHTVHLFNKFNTSIRKT